MREKVLKIVMAVMLFGMLSAVGEVTDDTIGDPVGIRLTADKEQIKADGADMACVTIETVDEQGEGCVGTNNKVEISVSGAACIVNEDKDDGSCDTSAKGEDTREYIVSNGRLQFRIRSTGRQGYITVKARGQSLSPAILHLAARKTES